MNIIDTQRLALSIRLCELEKKSPNSLEVRELRKQLDNTPHQKEIRDGGGCWVGSTEIRSKKETEDLKEYFSELDSILTEMETRINNLWKQNNN
jgi:hypothetical protein